MDCLLADDKPLPEPIMALFIDANLRIHASTN